MRGPKNYIFKFWHISLWFVPTIMTWNMTDTSPICSNCLINPPFWSRRVSRSFSPQLGRGSWSNKICSNLYKKISYFTFVSNFLFKENISEFEFDMDKKRKSSLRFMYTFITRKLFCAYWSWKTEFTKSKIFSDYFNIKFTEFQRNWRMKNV